MLQADVHYMPVTVDELPGAVERCLDDDALCESIAAQAMDLSKCELSLEAQVAYLARVLLLLQQQQASAQTPPLAHARS